MELLGFIVIGIVAGWIAGLIMKGRGFGLVGDLVVGVIGALVGGLLFRMLGIADTNVLGTLAMAVVGAVVFLGLASLFKRPA